MAAGAWNRPVDLPRSLICVLTTLGPGLDDRGPRDYSRRFFSILRNMLWTPKRPDARTRSHSPDALIAEGKTKQIYRINGASDLVAVISKDDITAGDGAKHDVIPDKGRLATATTCNVFRLLKASGLPVAFEEQDGPTSFVAPPCTMLPYEVVARREAHGSYLKRNPNYAKGQLFPQTHRRVLSQDQGQELERQAPHRRRPLDAL